MNQNPTSNIHPFTTPFVDPCPAAGGGETFTEPAAEPAPGASRTPAGGAAKRGRPFEGPPAPKVIEMLCAPIRQRGISDSAAAVQVGVSTISLSRWKKAFPEIALKLQQAREDCRNRHLDNIQRHA